MSIKSRTEFAASSLDSHADWAEIQLVQIEQMGLENYLETQTDAQAN